jgi:phosphatidyl-myo-inositol dimannoside synthase
MRVLLCSPVFPPARGGVETTADRLATFMDADVDVVTLDQPGSGAFDATYARPVQRAPNEPRGGRGAVMALNAATVRAGRATRPDVVLAMHVSATPAARFLRRLYGVPYVAYVHAKEMRQQPYVGAAAMAAASRVITVSRYATALALEAGAEPSRIRLVTPGVDLPTPEPRPCRDEAPTLVTVSRLEDRNKGHDVILAALPRIAEYFPDVRWKVIGDGRLRAALSVKAGELGVAERVDFLGAIDDAERDRWLDRATLFVMPTRRPADGRGGEGFGMVFVEAAAHGLTSVAARVPGVVDAVIDGETGVLVEPDQPLALAEAVMTLLGDSAQRHALATRARARADELGWSAVAARARTVLVEAAADPKPHSSRGRARGCLWPVDLVLPLGLPRPFGGALDPAAGF